MIKEPPDDVMQTVASLRAQLEEARTALRTIAESNITSTALRNIARTELMLLERKPIPAAAPPVGADTP